MTDPLDALKYEVAALIPEYREQGDVTLLITRTGEEHLLVQTVRSALQRLLRLFAVDVRALRRRCRTVLGRSNNLPIPLGPDYVLVPLKVREPRVDHDWVNGYVEAGAIARVIPFVEGIFRSRVVLANGRELPCCFAAETVREYLRNARLAVGDWPRKYPDMPTRYSGEMLAQPATKADIAVLEVRLAELYAAIIRQRC